MKTSLLLMSIVFFVVGVHCFPTQDGQSSLKREKRLIYSKEQGEHEVDSFNGDRRKYAKDKGYGNMWEIKWSDDLAEKIKEFNKDCNSLSPGPDYRFIFIGTTEKDLSWIGNESDYMRKHNINNYQGKTVHGLELLIPDQKEMGCGPYVCKNYKSVIPNGPVHSFEAICLLGPRGKIDARDLEVKKGASCEDEDGVDDDGLCVPSGSPMVAGIPILTLFVFTVSYLFH